MALGIQLSKGMEFENAPEGDYLATIYKIVDKGTQPQSQNFGPKADIRQLDFHFELTDMVNPKNLMKDGKTKFSANTNVLVSKGDRAKLTQIIKAVIGQVSYDEMVKNETSAEIAPLLGKSVYLSICHSTTNDVTYANVVQNSIVSLQPGVVAPPITNKITFLSLEKDEFKTEVFGSLPQKKREQIAQSPEFQALGISSSVVAPVEESKAGGRF